VRLQRRVHGDAELAALLVEHRHLRGAGLDAADVRQQQVCLPAQTVRLAELRPLLVQPLQPPPYRLQPLADARQQRRLLPLVRVGGGRLRGGLERG
jgi:hypothetical protein